jgi:hypothetical protein
MGVTLDTLERFENYLLDAAWKYGATIIAEELNEAFLGGIEGGGSIAKAVAEKLGVDHIFCDPDKKERATHGISRDPEREAYWARKRCERCDPNETSVISFAAPITRIV